MKCPFCGQLDSKVLESRLSKEGDMIRRRRECEPCEKRFTTYERVEETLPLVIKKDGRREPFDRIKIKNGILKACQKRPVSISTIEETIQKIESRLAEQGEIPSSLLGERVMEVLHELDDVAYVRFASVYRSFKDVGEFVDLIHQKENKTALETE